MAVTEHELEQQVRERIAGDRHAQVGAMREIDRRLATGDGDLLDSLSIQLTALNARLDDLDQRRI